MRTRERDDVVTDVKHNSFVAGPRFIYMGTNYPDTGSNSFKKGESSIITDVIGEYESENPCYHYVQTFNSGVVGRPYSIDRVVSPIGNCMTGVLYGPGYGFVADNSWTPMGVPINHPSTAPDAGRDYIPEYASEGWSNVYPVIREELKLINSIYELKDFSRLPSLARRTRTSFKALEELSLQRVWKRASARRGELRLMYNILSPQSPATWSYLLKMPRYVATRLSISDIVSRMVSLGQIAPEHFLNWKFAVEPLLRDMAHFSNVSRSVANQLPGLLARADGETVHKSHWSKVLESSEIDGLELKKRDESLWLGPYSYVYTRPWCEVEEGPKYTFTARYSYTYSPLAKQFAAKLAKRDALGVNLSAANIWQATPWSFVVDWFAKVGNMLEQLTPHNLEPIVRFYGASQSLKYKVKYCVDGKFFYSNNPDYSFSGTGEWEIATKTDECYIRQGVLPFVSLPKTSDFSTLEKVLALSLGISSVRYTS